MFQSSPGLRAGCYAVERQRNAPKGVVSILTRPSGRVLPPGRRNQAAVAWFQSSPGLRAGCYPSSAERLTALDAVSILTRPSGRVLRTSIRNRGGMSKFQSSPGLRAGCYLSVWPPKSSPGLRFNPHPAFGPGATAIERIAANAPQLVSILTRPSGRVLPYVFEAGGYGGKGFNPHPAFGPGATGFPLLQRAGLPRFNPHPAFGPGATALP